MLLAIGGNEDMSRQSTSTSAIYKFHCIDQTWKHAGEMSHKCSDVDTLLLSGGGLLVVDGHRQQVLKIEIEPSPKELGTDAKYVNVWEERGVTVHVVSKNDETIV